MATSIPPERASKWFLRGALAALQSQSNAAELMKSASARIPQLQAQAKNAVDNVRSLLDVKQALTKQAAARAAAAAATPPAA